jgi:hypothetical protein
MTNKRLFLLAGRSMGETMLARLHGLLTKAAGASCGTQTVDGYLREP